VTLIETSLYAEEGRFFGECWRICAERTIESNKTRTKQNEALSSLRGIIYENLTSIAAFQMVLRFISGGQAPHAGGPTRLTIATLVLDIVTHGR
jgi:hypothetical protein